MELKTLDGQPFLTVNGIQTMSYTRLNLVSELGELAELGIGQFRISPHSTGTMQAVKVFRAVLDQQITVQEAREQLTACGPDVPFSNGFFHHKPGVEWRVSGAPI